jgi:dTDP-L-rhamnose 4-epimerase
MKVLITGGAGFIGSHLADELLNSGHEVRVLDNLEPQVHGAGANRPPYLARDVELLAGDVRDPAAVARALEGVQHVVHLAATVGVGQSMYEIARYTDVNNVGTAVLLEALAKNPPQRLVVASSMSVYGEGLFRNVEGDIAPPTERSREQLERREWEVLDSQGRVLTPVPTPESKIVDLASVYALSKYDQERLCLMVGRAYRFPAVALRLFNVYGPRQALSNPYTGVLAIFASRLLNGNRPLVFEDGLQKRDFVHVRDVARAFRLALEASGADGEVINVGSGDVYTVQDIAAALARTLQLSIEPEITAKYRVGDVRHCFADIEKARRLLGFTPQVSFTAGLEELAQWLRQESAEDRVAGAAAELAQRGLTI